jgi:integrase
MARGKITKTSVDALICPDGKDREFLWDAGKGSLSGFGVAAHAPKKADIAAGRTASSGLKVFVIQFRLHGRSRRFAIGEYGKLTAEEARSQAQILLGEVERGIDPVEARKQARSVMTFREVADLFIRDHLSKKKDRTQANYISVINGTLTPLIGSRRMVDIPVDVISKAHAKMKDTPSAANAMLRILSSVWNWAERMEYKIGVKNPTAGIEFYKEEGKERFLSEDELVRLGDAMAAAETVGLAWEPKAGPNAKHAPKAKNRVRLVDPFAVAAIRLIALSGARKGEILKSRWEWVDFDLKAIMLPDANSKTGKKPLMLPEPALEILRTLPRIKGNPFIIPGEIEGQPRADLQNPWNAIRTAALLKGVRLHDLRHSFASLGVGDALGLPVVGKLLGHKNVSTTARYAHVHDDVARSAVEHIGGRIADAFATERKDNIVRLPNKRSVKNVPKRQAGRAPDKRA